MIRTTLALLIYASLACGQPWQWALVDSSWKNLSGFPQGTVLTIGDYDGDGSSDLLELNGQYRILLRDTTSEFLKWYAEPVDITFLHSDIAAFSCMNLDGDAADEIVVFPTWTSDGIGCYDVISTDPWIFQPTPGLLATRRPVATDSLLAAVWDDFDGDSLEECLAVVQRVEQTALLIHFERDLSDAWQPIDTIRIYLWDEGVLDFDNSLWIADYDLDNDNDVFMQTGMYDLPPQAYYLENAGGSLIVHDLLQNYSGPGGGELDGDPGFEWVVLETCGLGGYGPYLYDYVPPDDFILQADMRAAGGRVLGNVTRNDETVTLVHDGTFCDDIWGPPWVVTQLRYLTSGFWVNFESWNDGTIAASLGDVTGDGRPDVLRKISHFISDWEYEVHIRIHPNCGVADDDFCNIAGSDFITQDFDFVHDFSDPFLAQIDGTGNAEMLTTSLDSVFENDRTFMIFRLNDVMAGEDISPAYDLMEDLPPIAANFASADLDGDGMSEILIHNGVSWATYFFRNHHWETYDGVLPEIASPIRGFADWDGDGTTDIFTDQGVFLNLSPSSIPDLHSEVPSEFSFSAYPNPFNAQTTIAFDLPKTGDVSLKLFDLLGREVETVLQEHMNAGTHTFNYDAAALPSGVYFVRLEAGGFQSTHKLLLLK